MNQLANVVDKDFLARERYSSSELQIVLEPARDGKRFLSVKAWKLMLKWLINVLNL